MAQTVLNGRLNHINAAEGDNTDAFLFTSESVGEGHPGKEAGWSREVNIPHTDTVSVTGYSAYCSRTRIVDFVFCVFGLVPVNF